MTFHSLYTITVLFMWTHCYNTILLSSPAVHPSLMQAEIYPVRGAILALTRNSNVRCFNVWIVTRQKKTNEEDLFLIFKIFCMFILRIVSCSIQKSDIFDLFKKRLFLNTLPLSFIEICMLEAMVYLKYKIIY